MKNRLWILALMLLACVCAHAETIVLRTGARVTGTIIFQNDEVVIIRDTEGARFQYPKSDIEAIGVTDEGLEVTGDGLQVTEEEIKTTKKASILLELAGGAATRSNEKAGAGFGVDVLVGSHHIGDKHIFIGGGLGYHGTFVGGEKYNFLPLQVALRLPLMEQKHAPVFGAGLGYSVALSKNYVGGLYAGLDFGYRCRLNPRSAVSVVLFAQIHQAKVDVKKTIEEETFTNTAWRNMVSTGIKLAFYL